MYYTSDHERIEYSGHNPLPGIKATLSVSNQIQDTAFCHVLVDGKVSDINKKLLENPSLLLNGEPESTWILKINPNAPYKRDGLLQAHQYKSLKKKGHGTIHG